MIDEAIESGARQAEACELVGISARTYQRWHQDDEVVADKRLDNRPPHISPLSDAVRDAILKAVNRPEFHTLTPHQIVPMLLDEGIYIASESSFYRVMREHKLLKHRAKSTPVKRLKPKQLTASKPNQVYSWDITYLKSSVKGVFYYLYMVMDIYSRKIVGWQVHETESSELAAELMQDICLHEKIKPDQLTVHSDNGSPMKGATLRAKMDDLDIGLSFSRPHVSNDNPYSESLFKTVKYHCTFPEMPFDDLAKARKWVAAFVNYYNKQHRHSGIQFVTPEQRHNGQDIAILERRKAFINAFKLDHPERWNGRETRNLEPVGTVVLNPDNVIQLQETA